MCDTVVVVRPESTPLGAPCVLFAKNSDRDPDEAQILEWHPAADHPPGAVVRCSTLGIPQAERTAAVLISRPFWMWGAEMGLNEHGVVIGNEAVFTRGGVAAEGLSGMDLVRLGLERSRTAAEAVAVITDLLDRYPQGGPMGLEDPGFRYASTFLVADARGAFVLESTGSAHAVAPVAEGVRAISNGLTLPELLPQSRWLHTTVAQASTRRARVEAGASGAASVADLFGVLRDHGPHGTPRYRWLNGAMSAPCMHAGGLAAASQTTASLVVALGPEGVQAWATGTAAPCTSLFKPVSVHVPLDLGQPTDTPDDSLWWRHERLHRAVSRDPGRGLATFRAERDATEARWLRDPPEPAAAFAEGDALLARWTRELPALEDTRPWPVRRYWARHAQVPPVP